MADVVFKTRLVQLQVINAKVGKLQVETDPKTPDKDGNVEGIISAMTIMNVPLEVMRRLRINDTVSVSLTFSSMEDNRAVEENRTNA